MILFSYTHETINDINRKVEDNMGRKSIIVIEGP